MKITLTKPEKTILSAVKKYVDWIAPTYGPAGKKNLLVVNEFNHEAVDDGKRSSQAFELEDEFENAIIQYIKEVVNKAKDGSTTAGLIMGNIIIEAFKNLNDPLASKDFHGVALGLKKGLLEAVKEISKNAKQIKTEKELYAIAHNSYNDEKIAKLIANTIFTIGKDGILSIEDAKGTETTVEVVNGLEIPKGYASPYLINNEDKVVLENPAIILLNRKLNLFSEIFPYISEPSKTHGGRDFICPDLVIVAEGFGDDVIMSCATFKLRGLLRPLLIETPGYGNKAENLADIAAIVGATVADDKLIEIENVKCGTCEVVKASKDKTIFIGGKGKTKEYVATLKNQLENSTNNFEKDTLTKRIAVLLGGIAVIKIGAYTENEQKSIKAKVENAVNSTQIAYKSGVVFGAGKALLDIKTSSTLLNEALKAPRKQLEDNGAHYLDENTVDPADVVITALESAVSIASGLLTLGGISVPKRKKDKDDGINIYNNE